MEHASTSASWRRAWGLLALLPLASLSYCTPDPSAVVNRNIRFRAVIAGYPDSPTKKVSGTNESFSVSVTASSDMYEESDPHWDQAWVSYVKISIGGQTVQEWTWASPENQALIKNYSVRWATTQFDHGATPEVKVEAKCKVQVTGGSVTEFSATDATVDVDVYNYGFACEIPYATTNYPQASAVKDFFESMNHYGGLATSAGRDACFNPIAVATAYYFSGHGGSTPWFGDNAPNAWSVLDRTGDYAVIDQRADAATNGLPPVNFAYIDACTTGVTSLMSTAFLHPTEGQWNSPHYTVDRAEMGWRIEPSWIWASNFYEAFLDALADGATAKDARAAGWSALRDFTETYDPEDLIPNLPSETASDCLALYGDQQMRLNALYNGADGAAPSTWYEVL